MDKYSKTALEAAHKHSSGHHDELVRSKLCVCFFCYETFSPSEIEEWVDDNTCALCPKCGIDSVLGDASSLPVDDVAFMTEMHKYWF